MQFKKCGHTSVEFSSVVCGTGDFFWNAERPRAEKIKVIQAAIRLGVNVIDTAEGYGAGESELLVGEAIRECSQPVFVATKFSPENHSYDNLIRSCEESLKRLGRSSIDLYQMHWPNPAVSLEETMAALSFLFKQGKIKAIGLSNNSLREVIECQKWLGDIPISTLQTEYNLFERTIEENGLYEFCVSNGITILAYSPLDQGQLSAISPQKKSVLQKIADDHEKTVPQVILRWITSKKNLIVVSRTCSLKHLADNLGSQDFNLSLDEIQAIDTAFPIEYEMIDPERIKVSLEGEWNHQVYQTLEQALKNELGFVPSPKSLSESIRKGDCLKPVRLIRAENKTSHYDFDLVGGRIRYWAWVIAHGNKSEPIPAYIRKKYN